MEVRNLGWFIFLPLLMVGQVLLNRELRTQGPAIVEAPLERSYDVQPEMARFLAFGQVPVLVDWLLVRFLAEDPATSHVIAGTHPPAFYDLKLATQLDPAFVELYIAGACLLAVVRNDGPGAKVLLEIGEKFRREELPHQDSDFRRNYWRQSWQVPLMLAYVELFELKNMKAAAVAFTEAAQISGVPPHLQSLAAKLNRPGGVYEVAINLASSMIRQAIDLGNPVETLKTRLASLKLQYFLWQANDLYSKRNVRVVKNWRETLQSLKIPLADPLGGELYLDGAGKINTRTVFERELGLE